MRPPEFTSRSDLLVIGAQAVPQLQTLQACRTNDYGSVVDDRLRHPHDTAAIGLILCQTKDRVLAEHSLRDNHKPIGLADYILTRALPTELASSLPSIEDIEAELADEINGERAR